MDIEPPDLAPGAIVAAAVDVGANSAHVLVAAAGGHHVQPLLDESVFLGLGDRVTEHGYIGAEARDAVVAALTEYAATARRLGAQDIVIVGTEPLRRAADTGAVVHAVEDATGLALHVLDHREEAMLTLLGVTMGRPIRSRELVIDIGGGSSELVLGGSDGVELAMGLRLGCATLTLDHAPSDPPTLSELEAMRASAVATLAEAPDLAASEMVAVGGTASNLLKLMPSTSIDRVLTRRRIAVTLAMLSVQSSEEAAQRHLLRPQRARILPAGAVIMDAILERYGMSRVRVVEEGIREGAVLAAAAGSAAWRDRLHDLVRGWPDGAMTST
jgi:exopolyphosphatase/guanosine-5'-triphosphate,3'-diphosphate pyrophosphatase